MKNICILFGGQSSEHEVSCRSVMTILKNLPEDCVAYPVGITRDGRWYLYTGDISLIPSGDWEKENCRSAYFSPSSLYPGLTVVSECGCEQVHIDCVFPVLHGKWGEDGTLQGLLDLKGIPYVGCGTLSSAVSMDKSYTKMLVEKLGIRQADYVLIDRYNSSDILSVADECESKLGYPVFVKPCNSGSSVGVCRACDREALFDAISEALKWDSRVLIEEQINGRELEVAVLDRGSSLTASGVGEVLAADTFYSYDAKYNNSESRTDTSPTLPDGVAFEIREAAKKIFAQLNCKGLSRVDFFLENGTNEVVFNEINTLPGFTDISMYPMLIEKIGMSCRELVACLIENAMK
jgi:D-alanine-D-alanine ligase